MGFTLMEFAVAMVISTLLMVGAAYILRYMVVQTGANGDRTMAQLQAQYVSFWIGQDVVQAQTICFGNSTGTGFPLKMQIGLDGGNVTYEVVNNPDLGKNPYQLTRTDVNGTSLVAQYLDPVSTKCYGNETSGDHFLLVLEVAAQVDQSAASSTYELSPRYSYSKPPTQDNGWECYKYSVGA